MYYFIHKPTPTYITKGKDIVVRKLSTVVTIMYIINIKKEIVTIFHHEDGQGKMNNFIFT